MNESEVNSVANLLKDARIRLEMAVERSARAKAAVEGAELDAYRTGAVEGSNDKLRRAWLSEHLAEYYKAEEQADAEERAARLRYDLARIDWDRVRVIVSISLSRPESEWLI